MASCSTAFHYDEEYLKKLNYQELRIVGRGFDIGGKIVKAEVLVREILRAQTNKQKKTMDAGMELESQGKPDQSRRLTYELSPKDTVNTSEDLLLVPVITTTPQNKDSKKNHVQQPKIQSSTAKKTGLNVKSASKLKATPAPDFKRLHQRLFDGMDSLHDHMAKRNKRAQMLGATPNPIGVQGNAKDAVPKSSSKEFTPVVLSTRSLNCNFANTVPAVKSKPLVDPARHAFSKTPKVGLKASLVMKTKYMPNRGIVHKNSGERRDATRSVIQGVRSNRRFELQLKARGIQSIIM